MPHPKAVVFDLDYTLWPCWCDTHISTPIRLAESNNGSRDRLVDAADYVVDLYPDVRPILDHLRGLRVRIFTASRTATPRIAKKMLKLYGLEEYIDGSQWGYHSKIEHIERLVVEANRGVQPSDPAYIEPAQVVLFDDEWRNHDVERIGVTFCHLPQEELTWEYFKRGMVKWEEARSN